MNTFENRARNPFTTTLAAASTWQVVGAAGALAGVLWLAILVHFHGHVVDFAIFGQQFASLIHPPSNAHLLVGAGYDGQFYWRLATDPLMTGHVVIHTFAGGEAYRVQRMLFPLLAWLLAGGQRAALPYTLQLVTWSAAFGLVALFASAARRHGHSPWWGLALGLMPGVYLACMRDLGDCCAVFFLVGAVSALDLRRYGWATAAATAAVLTRETMMLLPIAILICLALSRMRVSERLERPRISDMPWAAWTAVAVPAAAYAAWQIYAALRLGTLPATAIPAGQFTGAFSGLLDQLHVTGSEVSNGGHYIWLAIANPLYLIGIVAVAGVAVWALTRQIDVPAVCAVLFALNAITQRYGDQWGYTRVTAPLFALVAYLALQRGYSRTLLLIGAGVLLLPMYPA